MVLVLFILLVIICSLC
ncbi:hypothetical protein [Tannockella kyphosi]